MPLELRGGVRLDWVMVKGQEVTRCNGKCFRCSYVTSGVPQGSVLGPLLFVIYINDIELGISSNIRKFADDTKLFWKVGNEERCEQLRADLRKLYEWSVDWQMLFNLKNVNLCTGVIITLKIHS